MKILVLAGGADQIALIKELQLRNHEVVLVDYFENPPAKQYVKKHIIASTLDVEKVLEIAISEKVDILTTACTDQALLTVANVSEQLGLPCYISYQTGLNVTNKLYMKKVLVENDIPTAKYFILDKVDTSVLKTFDFPIVVKPVDCNSSKGVKKVETLEEYKMYLKEAICYSRTKTAIIEEFKSGNEISADFYIENGVVKYLSATSSLKIKNKNSFTILCSDYPAISELQEKEITKIASDIAKAFNLDNCPLLIQLIEENEKFYVLEFSARMGGGSKYKLIEVLSGVNIMSKYVDRILGGIPKVNPKRKVNYCKMVYLYCNRGVFDHIEGLQELKHNGIVDAYFEYKTKGMEITNFETSGDRPAGYLITANTSEELNEKIRVIDSHIKVVSREGDDIMIHGLI